MKSIVFKLIYGPSCGPFQGALALRPPSLRSRWLFQLSLDERNRPKHQSVTYFKHLLAIILHVNTSLIPSYPCSNSSLPSENNPLHHPPGPRVNRTVQSSPHLTPITKMLLICITRPPIISLQWFSCYKPSHHLTSLPESPRRTAGRRGTRENPFLPSSWEGGMNSQPLMGLLFWRGGADHCHWSLPQLSIYPTSEAPNLSGEGLNYPPFSDGQIFVPPSIRTGGSVPLFPKGRLPR